MGCRHPTRSGRFGNGRILALVSQDQISGAPNVVLWDFEAMPTAVPETSWGQVKAQSR